LTFGDFEYTLLEDGTVEIARYIGSDTEVEIPAEINGAPVTSIGFAAFEDYYDDFEITSIVIPDSVTKIDDSAFEYCSKLESITLPENLKYIGVGAFYKCLSLKSITLPKDLKSIEGGTFENCSSLESIDIPDSVEIIGDWAFKNCSALKKIVIPDSLEEIGWGAFCNCGKNLRSITIPKSVTYIGYDAFSDYDEPTNTYKNSINLMINCYMDSYAYHDALESGSNFNVIDADGSKTKYPELIKEEYSSKYRQFRLTWTEVEGAEQYGIAIKNAGKWKVVGMTDADVTTYTSPKLTAKKEYIVAICAKINGKWDTSNLNTIFYDGKLYGRTFPLVVR
ncbi:leucine-rich repeat domain-containing protein, partial [Ruminococcus albus]